MKKFSARQLHHQPQKVYSTAHREPIVISHRSHGDMLLISPTQIISKHTHIDGTVQLHLRPTDQLQEAQYFKSEKQAKAGEANEP